MNSNGIFVKKESLGIIGKLPQERTIEELLEYGIVNLDKPKGPTSHQVSSFVKEILKLDKAGHSGTLDPAVTGVQPVALGKGTKISQFLLTAPKEYVCLMHLHRPCSLEKLNLALEKFRGKISQLPPIKSAIKRVQRTREIYELELLEFKEQDVLFRVKCEAGTYIRKLCHDIGQELEIGAHMAELRRTQAGPFTEKDKLVTLNTLNDAYHFYKEGNSKLLQYCLQPLENCLTHLKKCWIVDSAIESLSNGRDLAIPGISKLENFRKGETVAVLTLKGELLAIGEATMSAVQINTLDKGIGVEIKKVFNQVQLPSLANLD
jgi:H/ACA ribonucleoprotein complex subunit 4